MKYLHILQHSLGLDQYGQGQAYRNHYCAGPGHHSYDECMALVDRGLMTRQAGSAISSGDDIFRIAADGRNYVANNSQQSQAAKTHGRSAQIGI